MKKNNLVQGKKTVSNDTIDSRIEAVRDLIFGENIQQYNSEFDDVYTRIDQLKEEIDKNFFEVSQRVENKVQEMQNLMDAKMELLTTNIDKKIARLNNDKADRKKLGKALEKIALMLQE